MTNSRDSIDMTPCCADTLAGVYADWCRNYEASEAPALDAYAHLLVSTYAPLMRDLLSDIGVPFHVVNTQTGATGALLSQKCSCGRSRNCIIMTSSVMLYLWRVLSTVASMATHFEQLPNKIRVEFRDVTDADIEQFRTALELYFGRAPPADADMPGKRFQLQLFLGSQHRFEDNKEAELIGHSYAVDGILGDYVNLLNEPVFRNLQVADLLKLRIGVNFLVNKTTQEYAELLKSDVVTRGIELTRSYNPVFGSALAYIRGVTSAILKGRGNKAIISHDVTFTAKPSPTVPTLCAGTYLFIQVPKDKLAGFDWTPLRWDPRTSRVLEVSQPVEWNHLILRLQAA